MAVNVANAFVANPPIDGGVYFNAPVGTPLPMSIDDDLDPAFQDHGAVGPDGFNVNPKRESSTEKMFGGEDWVDLQTGYTEEVTLTLLEDDNINVLHSLFGEANVKETQATSQNGVQRTIYHTNRRLPIKSHVLKAIDGEKRKTIVVPRGRISTVEKTPDVHSASTKYNVTITCFKGPAEHNFAYAYELRDDGMVVLGGGGPQVKKVMLPAGVTGGTWSLTVDGHTANSIAHNAAAAAVQVAIRAAGATGVTVAGGVKAGYRITGGTAVSANGAGLTGGASTTITVT